MIDLTQFPQLNYLESLKNTSIDKHDNTNIEYMTNCEKNVINFDKVKENYISDLGVSEAPKSNDALLLDKHGNLIFVEFKNGFMDKPKQYGIRKKIYDSLLIFSDITNLNINSLRSNAKYILVYNEIANIKNPDISAEVKAKQVQESQGFNSLAQGIRGLGSEEYVLFGINIFKNYCFKSLHTYTKKEFETYIKNEF